MPDSLQICPACGTPVADGAVFCDACGAELHAGSAEGQSHAESAGSAEGQSHAESAEGAEKKFHAKFVENAVVISPTLVLTKPASAAKKQPKAAAVPASAAGTGGAVPSVAGPFRSDSADDVPFELEWDEARNFIEGRAGQLAFRFKALCNLAKAGVRAVVNGESAGVQLFSSLQAGRTREGLFDIEPSRPGTLSVQLRVETLLDGRTHETFEGDRCLEHEVYPATRQEVRGAGNVTVNYAPRVENNTGIVRQDDARISVSGPEAVRVDHWADQDRVLGRRGSFVRVGFDLVSVARENVRFRASGAALDELLVVPGADAVSFGRSVKRADVILAAETPDGETDATRSGFVSGVHFTIRRDRSRETFSIVDGGPSKDDPKQWIESTNGLAVDGEPADAPRSLPAGRRISVTLAPHVMSGGALSLTLETRGWNDPAAAGCTERAGNLSSLLVRRLDSPRKAILVVWGGAALDPVLGTKVGLRVVSLRGRLYFADASGRIRRLNRLAGTRLEGTPYTIR